jgi:ureidoacrylate peracid hydrolase
VREAHVRDFGVTVLEDGCAAFTPKIHEEAIAALRPVAQIATVSETLSQIGTR